MYFEWFKTNNHLYKNVDFDTNLIDNFLAESNKESSNFENNTREDEEAYQSDDDGDEIYQSDVDELPIHNDTETFEPPKSDENDWTHDQATMFLNKYCENTDIPTVANRIFPNFGQKG